MSDSDWKAFAIDPAIVECAAEAMWREKCRLSISIRDDAQALGEATWPDIDRGNYRALTNAALQAAIPKAVEAERKRCAKIVREFPLNIDFDKLAPDSDAVAQAIAGRDAEIVAEILGVAGSVGK